MNPSTNPTNANLPSSKRLRTSQKQNPTEGTIIFSSLAGARLCDIIGHYMYLFKPLRALQPCRFYRTHSDI
jgi:hypothetical protein